MELLTDVTVFKHKLWAFEYANRMEKWFSGLKQAPIRIDAELHTRCNLNCIMCDRRNSVYDKLDEEGRNKMEMPVNKWVQIAEESGKMGVKAWNISGLCEPLAKPEVLFPTMRMIKAYDMFGELTTNGTLWNEKFMKETIEMGWDSVCISIDSSDAETHDFIRGVRGTFKKATNTLLKFNKLRKKYKTSLPVLTVNVVLNKLNYLKLKEIVKMAYTLGADAIFVEPIVVFTKLCNELKMGQKEISEFMRIAEESQEIAKECGIVLDITAISPEIESIKYKELEGEMVPIFSKKKFDEELIKKSGNIKNILIEEAKSFSDRIFSIPCYYPWFFLMIRANGSTVHCGEWRGDEENVRNKNLGEVWFGNYFERIRNQFSEGELPQFCEKCRPNVVEDMRIVRKSIKEFRDINWLRVKYLEFLEENKKLKQKLFSTKKGDKSDGICVACEYKKELERFKNSLTYKLFSVLQNKRMIGILKKILRF